VINKKVVHVAVGFIVREQQVLISWRSASQHQGNRYEFPGGKIEADETPEQGLIRELREELGIEVQHPVRAQQLNYDYPEKTVCLHVFKVTQFTGDPVGQEGQHIRWIALDDLPDYQFPDANAPILRLAKLPTHYLICHEQTPQQSLTDWLDFHQQAVPPNAWLYVRHHQLNSTGYQRAVNQLSQSRPDLNLVLMYRHYQQFKNSSIRLAGVHYAKQDIAHDVASQGDGSIRKELLQFAACHTPQEIQHALQLGVDAIILSPVNATLTHPDATPLGWQAWQSLCQQSSVPVYALGGMTPNDIVTAEQYGGYGVAGIRGFY
jgi:8-oxo-dGTP diphosphatase